MSLEHEGWQRYLTMRPEAVWGVRNGAGSDIYVPYTDYSVAPAINQRQADIYTGTYDRRHNRRVNAKLSGALTLPLWGQQVGGKSIAEYIFTWALNRAGGYANPAVNMPSYTIDINDPSVTGKRHFGNRVSSITLSGEAESGEVKLSVNLEGQSETPSGITVASLTGTEAEPIDFLFKDVEFEIANVATGMSASSSGNAVDLRSFELTITNNLAVYHSNSYWPTRIPAGQRYINFKFTLFKTDATYDAFATVSDVVERAIFLRLLCPHLGSGANTYSFIEFTFDRVSFANVSDQKALNELVTQDVEWIGLKPNTSANALTFTAGTM